MIKHLSKVPVLIALLMSSFVNAQDSLVTSDFEAWAGITLQKSFFDKKLDLSLTQEFRFDDNSSHLDKFFTQLAGKYEIIDGLSIGLGYRYIRNRRNSEDRNEQRFHADVSYKHKVDRLTLNYRFRFQNRNELGRNKSEGSFASNKYRLRIKAKYNIKNWKFDPYISIEGFFGQERNSLDYVESVVDFENISGFEKLRYTIGTNYKVAKFLDIGIYYRIEQGFKSYPNNYNLSTLFYIGGLNLNFNL
ncbi:MAG: DUF2490 domain-containing protein [Crocinitomicaceae bacterium]|nr:DUF2490 domain-containing protein [Crocinitomicaceae bacterium]